jgi:hypothetical protein
VWEFQLERMFGSMGQIRRALWYLVWWLTAIVALMNSDYFVA